MLRRVNRSGALVSDIYFSEYLGMHLILIGSEIYLAYRLLGFVRLVIICAFSVDRQVMRE
jgi:hypothetical protein